jgi:hypothetical protein
MSNLDYLPLLKARIRFYIVLFTLCTLNTIILVNCLSMMLLFILKEIKIQIIGICDAVFNSRAWSR